MWQCGNVANVALAYSNALLHQCSALDALGKSGNATDTTTVYQNMLVT